MQIHRLSAGEWIRTLAIGLAVAILTAFVMQILARAGISPMPEPLGLAFAKRLLGSVPLPVGLLFHTAWIMAFVALFVVLFRDALTFSTAFWLAAALWVLVLVFFFPMVGWGFLGLSESPKLIVAAGAIHLLFALLLWIGCRLAFRSDPVSDGVRR